MAYMDQQFTVRFNCDSILWGVLPKQFWYLPTKFCKWAILPHLKWIGSNVVIPLPVMAFLRRTSWHIALLIGAVELVDVLNEIIRKLLPLFDDEDTPSNYREFVASQKKRKQSLFFEYDDFHPGYKPLFFIYRPIAWALFAIDKYRLLPIWTRLTRIGKVEVKTINKSKYYKGMKVIVGGTRIRYPGVIGALEKPNVWLPTFVLDVLRSFFMAFATGNLYIFNWRV